MAKGLISIEFDRANRTYQGGEDVTGTVQVAVGAEIPNGDLYLSHYWQTHGRGNQDAGARVEEVVRTGAWTAGEVVRFPFRFAAPPGPATYRGQLLNVDHYVEARLRIPWASDPTIKEEFLLRPGASDYVAGDPSRSLSVLPSTVSRHKRYFIPIGVGLIAIGGLIFFPFGLVSIPLGLYLLYLALRNSLAERRLGRVGFQLVSPDCVPGEDLLFELTIDPPRPTGHNGITARLTGKEVAISGSGTDRKTHNHVFLDTSRQLAPPGNVTPEEPLRIAARIAIPPEAPLSFYAADNQILWQLDVRIHIAMHPDWIHAEIPQVVPYHGASRPALGSEPISPSAESTEPIEATAVEESAPQTASPVVKPSATREAAESLAAVLKEIAALDRFSVGRSERIAELADQWFECSLVVVSVSHIYGVDADDTVREDRSLVGTLSNGGQQVVVLCGSALNERLDNLRRGDTFALRCRLTGWDDLYRRAELVAE